MQLKDVILIQGIYYFVTGIWPILHLPSFEKITGRKNDHWLLFTVSWMIVSSSLVFLYSSIYSRSIPNETLILAFANIFVLTGIDVYYSIHKIIRKVYLMDGVIEIFLLLGIIYLL